MKNKLIYLSILIVAIFTSCDDTLDSRLSTSIDAGDVITDLESLDLAVNGNYSLFANEEVYNRTAILLPDFMSDNLYLDAFNNTGRYLPFDDYTVLNNNGNVSSLYTDLARIIAQSSIIIREAAGVQFPASELEDANQFKGEAHFIRALGYLKMQEFFAQPYNFTTDASHLGVPIPDVNALGGIEIISPARSTTAQVYEQIVNDLQQAIALMRPEEQVFRADQWAAKSLLARVYINMEEWGDAEALASEVINMSGATLITRGAYTGSWSNDFSDESIFSLANSPVDNSGFDSVGYFYLGYDDAFPTPDFLSLFTTTDVRSLLYPIEPTSGEARVFKFPDQQNQSDNIPVIRLSEMYLIKAEAHARQPGQETQAQAALDEIRLRGDNQVTLSTETGQALIDKVMIERRKELAFEGFRLFDLTRTGTNFMKFRQDLPAINITAPSDLTILPIPLVELNRNRNIQPNPGY